ncbi:DUF192 domain-containing protein [Oxynema sp. CENA135]|uniref:DUF192 domain-containing protein n=1 Tax=Oxynema sp. CENA135 TaxID=984206 RepID=UPI00351C9A61
MLKWLKSRFSEEVGGDRPIALLQAVTMVLLSLNLFGCTPPATSGEPTPEPPAPSPSGVRTPALGQRLPIEATLKVGEVEIELEVARSPAQKAIGLMHRDRLDPNRGMLFPFDPPQPVTFWMKNVSIPLDMLFLRDGRVQAIGANIPPCTEDPCPTYGPPPEILIDNVIELPGGRAAELGIREGDRLTVEWLDRSLSPTDDSP